eukprot:GFUD01024975.1.p1 GENE.GFUD01024975.1~~GFUD01024975.1.p1  ORF type:complete len:298 (-),score=86.00 GFUD01024975.1:168-1061(-)
MSSKSNTPQLAWLEELNILTKFHPSNVGFGVLERVKEEEKEGLQKMEIRCPITSNRVRGVGRGSCQDDSHIATLGIGHRFGIVLNSSKTSTISELSVDNDSTVKKLIPVKDPGATDAGQSTTVRTKLVKKNSIGNGSKVSNQKIDHARTGRVDQVAGKGVAEAMNKETPSPRGRGRGRQISDFPSVAVATMIQQNVGQGHRLDVGASRSPPSMSKNDVDKKKAANSNNNNKISYFPTFDYGNLTSPAWWANSVELDSECSAQPKSSQVNMMVKKEEQERMVVQKAVMTKWTPLDDSV